MSLHSPLSASSLGVSLTGFDMQGFYSEANDLRAPLATPFSIPPGPGTGSNTNSMAISNPSWVASNNQQNFQILSVATHEHLIGAQNAAYKQLCQRISSITKDHEILQAKYATLE